tara:strand:+ start:13772 stop:14617 length:846 start_codon:yes stop_codon:yes gene_type:complete
MEKNEIQEILLEEFKKQQTIDGFTTWDSVTNNLIECLTDVDLSQYTDNPKHVLKKLEKDSLTETTNIKSGICELNDAIIDKIVCDVYLIEIVHFYPTVIKQLIESGILDTTEDFNKVFLTIFYFLRNNRRIKVRDTDTIRSENFQKFYKTWMNYTFGVLYKSYKTTSEYRHGNTINITMYTRNFFNDVIKNMPWIYVDTDSVFLYMDDKKDDVFLDMFGKHDLLATVSPIRYAYFKSKKRYFYINNANNITYKGIKEGKESDVEDALKVRYRDDEINKILS